MKLRATELLQPRAERLHPDGAKGEPSILDHHFRELTRRSNVEESKVIDMITDSSFHRGYHSFYPRCTAAVLLLAKI